MTMDSTAPNTASLQQSMLLYGQAMALRQQGKLQAAAQAFQQAIRVCPLNGAPYHGLTEMLAEFGDFATAAQVAAATPAAIYQQSKGLQALHAVTLLRQGNYAAAQQLFTTLEGAPGLDQARLCFHLGWAHNGLGNLPEAVAYYRKALQAGLAEPGLYTSLGTTLQKLGRIAEASALYDDAASKFPRHGDLRYEQAIFLLRQEHFARGFSLLRHRWQSGLNSVPKIVLPIPEWDGNGRVERLLVIAEQGIGDQLVYAALLPGLQARTGQLTVAFDTRLHALLQRSIAGLQVAASDAATLAQLAAQHDAFLYAADIGAVTTDNVGWRQGPLQPDTERVRALQQRYRAEFPGQKLVGISWRSPKAKLDAHKSIDLGLWQDILTTPGCQFISLQYGAVHAELQAVQERVGIRIYSDPGIDSFTDIDGLAAQVAALDQVITVSNSTAHVAAAVGTPTWVLLSRAMGLFWYWGLQQDCTAWYPAARLFRARQEGQWADVLAAVATALRAPA